MRALLPILIALVGFAHTRASAQSVWEYLGPGVGYRPEAFFVSERAIYLGLADQDGTGLGLYRYLFDPGEWDRFAWPDYRILGITVWGPSDENILLIRDRPGEHCVVLRSKDGGGSWVTTRDTWYSNFRLAQAPSDTARVLIADPTCYSTDGGWSWNPPHGALPGAGPAFTSFDPSNALVTYMTAMSYFGFPAIYKSTTGGAYWRWCCENCGYHDIRVEREDANHVMTAGPWVSTDAGTTWSWLPGPFIPLALASPSWAPEAFFGVGSDLSETTYEAQRTTDVGQTWSPCGEGLPTLPPDSLFHQLVFLEAHPTRPELYAALEGAGVWKWQYTGAGIPDMRESGQATRLFAYPVPSSGDFTYGMRLPATTHASLRLFDARGRLIRVLQDGVFSAGTHLFRWTEAPRDHVRSASGVYVLRLEAGDVRQQRKILLAR